METPSESIRVLHVDDEPDFADMAAAFLKREDGRFDIETATNASEGLDRLGNDNFDCVVSDYDMPGQNGMEFLEAVRETDPGLPFILFTGKGSEEVASDAISAGVTDYLQKESSTEQYQLLAKRILDAVEHHYAKTSYQEIFEKVPDGIVIHDPTDGSFTDMNTQYAELFGYEREEMLEAGFATIHTNEEPYTVESARQRVREAAGQGPQSFEWPAVTKDGDQFWAEVHLTPTQLHGNERILAVVRDISDRKERERRFEAVFNNTYTFSGLLEPDGTLVEANDTALSFGGVDRSDVLGKPIWETDWVRGNGDARETVREAVEQARDGEFFRDEIRIHGSDRDAVIDFSIRPIVDEQGEVELLVPEGRDITERKERERRLEESERTYRTLAENFPDGAVGVYDRELRYDLVEGAMWEYMDANADDLEGNMIHDVFSESVVEDIEPVFRAALDSGETNDVLTEFESRTLRVWATPLRDSDGEIFAGLSFAQDITDQVERERELERTLDLLEHTERLADVGGWEIDTVTQDVFWSDHLFEMLGVEYDEEPPLEEALDVYVEEDRPRVEQAVEKGLAVGDPFDVEARFRRSDDEIRWFQIQGYPTIENGEVVTLRGAVQDITAHKERQRELEATEARFQALAENFPNGAVHYFDSDLRYQYAAGAAFDVIETSAEDLVGNTIYEIDQYSEETIETVEPLMTSTLDGNEEWTEVTYEEHVFELRSVPIRDADNSVIGGFFIAQDITDKHRRERTLERQNEQLDQFASVVSHDLRNPLNVAQGYVELAQEDCDSDHLDGVHAALERSQTLIDDLLTLAREGTKVSDVQRVNLGTVSENCWHNVATAEASIITETNLIIEADRGRLKQLLENIYRNAIEHGGDDTTVTVGNLDDGFYVEDDGSGIPENEREDVFEIGYSTVDEGTGFGLSIVKQIVEAHSWEIQITESAKGGARFEITGVEIRAGDEP